jgi:predicted Zn finger-like uncharacterized protein
MFILCEKCGSLYEIDPARLKPEGSKVRCSVCGFVFTAKPEPEAVGEAFAAKKPLEDEKAITDLGKDEPTDLDDLLKELEISSKASPSAKSGVDGASETKAPASAPPVREQLKPYRFEEKKKRSYLRTVLLLILLFLVGAAGSIVLFAPELIPWKIPFITASLKEVPDTGAKWLSLSEVKGGFLESKASGRLFVIRGRVKNNDKAPRGMILLKASLLDQKGATIRSIQLYAGNSKEDSELSEMELGAIKAAMANRSGEGNSNLRLEPGASIPFMAVFDDLPQNLSEFAVEPVASSPVGR